MNSVTVTMVEGMIQQNRLAEAKMLLKDIGTELSNSIRSIFVEEILNREVLSFKNNCTKNVDSIRNEFNSLFI